MTRAPGVGECTPGAGGEGFDGFVPVDDVEVPIEVAADIESLDWCNWF